MASFLQSQNFATQQPCNNTPQQLRNQATSSPVAIQQHFGRQGGYHGNQPMMVSRNSTSTPSPSEVSLSPPPLTYSPSPDHSLRSYSGGRCASVESSMSEGSASPFQGSGSPIQGGFYSSATPTLQCATPQGVPAAHSPPPRSECHFVPAHQANASSPQQQRLGNQPPVSSNSKDVVPSQEALDLSSARSVRAANFPEVDENHHDIDVARQQAAGVAQGPMWRPW